MNETQLQIVVSLVNEAADQLTEVGAQLSNLGTQAADASEEMTSSLTAAEEAMAAAAEQSLQAWSGATDEIAADVGTMGTEVYSEMQTMAGYAALFPEAIQAQSQAAMDDLEATLAEAEGPIAEAAATVGEEAGTAMGEGFGGYFKKMIVGYALEQIGSFLSGGIESAIASVSKSSDQIATLSAQIQQQKADIDVNEAALQKWVGTTAEVNAAHVKAAANIEAEKAKITELTQQLAPLTQAQQGLTGGIQGVVDEILQWIGAHKQLEGELQTFMTTLGPMLQAIGAGIIVITLLSVAFSMLSPEILILIALGVTIATLTAIWQTFHTQIVAFFDDLNAKTGIITFLQQAWDLVVLEFEDRLLPALQKLWTALQPLMPLLQAIAVVIGVTLLGALVLLVDILTTGVTWFTNALTAATNFATFLTNVLVVAINKVEDALNAVFSSAAFKAVSGLVGGAVSGISSVVGGAVKAFASGGIVNSPTLALVGEAGPEAIIPLSAFQGGSSLAGGGGAGSAGAINIYIQGGNFLDSTGATMIANALATQIGRQIKLRNFF